MSERDRLILKQLGVKAAKLAAALELSRQAVSRSINSPKDYLTLDRLLGALKKWEATDPALCAVTSAFIRAEYGHLAEVLALPEQKIRTAAFDPNLSGEYIFLSDDLVGFTNEMPACAAQLEVLCAGAADEVRLVIKNADEPAAHRLARRFSNRPVRISTLPGRFLLLIGILIRTDELNSVSLFGSGDEGFTPLAASEGVRIRSSLVKMGMLDR